MVGPVYSHTFLSKSHRSVYMLHREARLPDVTKHRNGAEWTGMGWNGPEWTGMTPEWTRMTLEWTRMTPEWTGMTLEWTGIDSFYTCLKELFWKKNIVCIFFKSIWRGIKCAVTKMLLIILHSLTPSLPPMHPFCSESNNLGKGEGGPRYVELSVKPYTMEIDSI